VMVSVVLSAIGWCSLASSVREHVPAYAAHWCTFFSFLSACAFFGVVLHFWPNSQWGPIRVSAHAASLAALPLDRSQTGYLIADSALALVLIFHLAVSSGLGNRDAASGLYRLTRVGVSIIVLAAGAAIATFSILALFHGSHQWPATWSLYLAACGGGALGFAAFFGIGSAGQTFMVLLLAAVGGGLVGAFDYDFFSSPVTHRPYLHLIALISVCTEFLLLLLFAIVLGHHFAAPQQPPAGSEKLNNGAQDSVAAKSG